ncbi:MAG TPA: membrane protein insertion efficiency factor YidD [Desulfobacteraceae bacterium]|nr:membrane protein insertion efficiency factor YidD [Desulfobacteraceae bacterium]
MKCDHVRRAGDEPARSAAGPATGRFARFCVAILRWYKHYISPFLPPSCRFTPTCSQYAIDAVKKHGVLRGLLLALWRLLRCHPFARGGYDPVK